MTLGKDGKIYAYLNRGVDRTLDQSTTSLINQDVTEVQVTLAAVGALERVGYSAFSGA